jgi:hypothetical protein
MKCFNHPSNDAVAICKNCNKGLCTECAVDVGNGIACKGICEGEVIAINKVVQQSKKTYANTSKTYAQYSAWFALVGIAFLVSSIFLTRTTGFLIFMGLLFLLGATFTYLASKRFTP